MVTLRNIPPENMNKPGDQQQRKTMEKEEDFAHKISEYELSREERIKENRERMQKLGIVDLSIKLNALKPTPKRAYQRKIPQCQSPLPPSGPVRRSSRLQNSTPVSYCEVLVAKKEKSSNDDHFLREEGLKPEVYTDEHEKLLGSIEKSWTLFVDGYGKDGKRIYDPVKGKTCHQCRQKTLGHRTHCSKCSLVQGQFCGDCLYMRYGENVLEANENPNWICPVCRGICNCSLCRQAKGWPPTGTLYRKISNLGYKSVAHYLIQTRRSNTDSDKNVGTLVPVSAKRSLPFLDIEITKGDDDHSKSSDVYLNTDPISQSDKEIGDCKIAPESEAEPLLKFEESNIKLETVTETKTTIEPLNDRPLLTGSSECSKGLISEFLENGDDEKEIEKENNLIPDKKRVRSESTPDSIAGRLRQRHNQVNNGNDMGLVNEQCATRNGEKSTEIADADSIASRMKMRRRA